MASFQEQGVEQGAVATSGITTAAEGKIEDSKLDISTTKQQPGDNNNLTNVSNRKSSGPHRNTRRRNFAKGGKSGSGSGSFNNNSPTTNDIDTDRWCHDRFDMEEQKPKSESELVKRYGFDIRTAKDVSEVDLLIVKTEAALPTSAGKKKKRNNRPVNQRHGQRQTFDEDEDENESMMQSREAFRSDVTRLRRPLPKRDNHQNGHQSQSAHMAQRNKENNFEKQQFRDG